MYPAVGVVASMTANQASIVNIPSGIPTKVTNSKTIRTGIKIAPSTPMRTVNHGLFMAFIVADANIRGNKATSTSAVIIHAISMYMNQPNENATGAR